VRKTEKRQVESFTGIETTGAFEVIVDCQKPLGLEIEADDNLLPLVQTEVRGDVLHVTSTKNYSSNGGIVLRITVPNLEGLETKGAGKFQIADLKNDHFWVRSTGAAKVIASGQSKSIEITSTGAGEIDARDLLVEKADVRVTGAAGVDVSPSDTLDIEVSGAGRVTYSGNPKISKSVKGAGQVKKRESSGV
jgi:hypothetical protein